MLDSSSWGKTWRKRRPAALRLHRLEHHLLDVLAVMDALIERDPGLLVGLARALDLPIEDARRLVRWCAIVHDTGKVAGAFQGKSDWARRLVRPLERCPTDLPCAHDMVGFAAANHLLLERGEIEGFDSGVSTLLASAFFHHGRPRPWDFSAPDPTAFSRRDRGRFAWLMDRAADLVGWPRWPDEEGAAKASWLLCGVVSLADGFGSAVSERVMETAAGVPPSWVEGGVIRAVPWADYLETVSGPLARRVLGEIGGAAFLPLPKPSPMPDLEVLAAMAGKPVDGFVPSPLQEAVCRVRLGGQFWASVEDVTGGGKTEGSGLMVRRALLEGISEGGFWSLPTMATANGLYPRFRRIAPLLYGGDPALVLAHGARDDVRLFRDALRDVSGDPVHGAADEGGGATCVDWLTEGAHRSLLAHCGVGTIDQALFAALNSYHCGMRWLGLHRKVLVADEVHAADAGMVELLCQVLRHHAALGGSVILMSATLPSCTRDKLLAAFRSGAGWPEDGYRADRISYPLLTVATQGRVEQIPLEVRADRQGVAHRIRRVGSAEECLDHLADWAHRGRCAVWFRNTVRDAIQGHALLRARGVRAILFHSRFTRARREEIEREVMRRFGPASGPRERAGFVLVSTQVAEQSLDVDFDEAVLDLAPADLLLQRLGRRRRHRRCENGQRREGPDGRPDEDVLLLAPDPDDVRDAGWLKSLLPGADAVYADTAAMWLTARLMLCPADIPERRPGCPADAVVPHLDARPLVEAIYPPDRDLRRSVPAPLRAACDRVAGKGLQERQEARGRAFAFREGYWAEASTVAAEFENGRAMTATRTGEGAAVFLACFDGAVWRWLEDDAMTRSSVPLREILAPDSAGQEAALLIARRLEAAIDRGDLEGEEAARARRELGLLRRVPAPAVIAMRRVSGGAFSGAAIRVRDGREVAVSYDPESGLQVSKGR